MSAYERLGLRFDQGKKTVYEVLGMSRDEFMDVVNSMFDAIEECETITEAMEKLLKKYDGAKAIFAIYSLGVRNGAVKAIKRILAAATAEGFGMGIGIGEIALIMKSGERVKEMKL